MEEDNNKQAYRIGAVVIGLLAVLTIGEYLIGSIASVWWAPLLGIAILKGQPMLGWRLQSAALKNIRAAEFLEGSP